VNVRFAWIENRRADLIWYVGSPLLALAYVPVAYLAARGLTDPSGAPRFAVTFGAHTVPLTAGFVVLTSWALFLDGPHFWPTLVRTVLDPDEWRARGGVLARSFALFLLGPALVLAPWAASAVGGPSLSPAATHAGARLLLVIFLAWAYWHVVRQHWGFVRIYRRTAGEDDPADDRMDRVFFHVALLLPPLLFLTHPDYPRWHALYPRHGLHDLGLGGATLAAWLHRATWVAWSVAVLAYGAWQVRRARAGRPLNGPKLLLLGAIVPVHLVPFLHPALTLFAQVIVGVGHAVQYQRIVWRFGRRRYATDDAPALPRRIFASPVLYLAAGVLFTVLLLRGPWVEWVVVRGGAALTAALDAVANTAGPPGARPLGALALWGLFLGWLFQHYYLDAKIWKVRDREVRRDLGVEPVGD
jgi:hypothetical protein